MHCIEAGMPPSLTEEIWNDEERTMEETYNEEQAPATVMGFTIAQAQFDALIAKEEQQE